MIDLYNGELFDLLPSSFKSEETEALSYALKQVTQYIIDKAKATRTQSVIDELPEPILDLLATELRALYYSQDMPIEQKRSIIKQTLAWHFLAGTPSAVEELLSNVIGDGCELEEWFDYGGDPGYFRVCVDISNSSEDNPMEEQDLTDLQTKALRVKRFSAWMENFSYMIKNGITIGKAVERWLYNTPLCGTIYCGQYWTPSTLGYTEGDGITIGAVADAFAHTSDFCGTLPNISTLGFDLQNSELMDAAPNGYVYLSAFCGIPHCGE